MQDFCNLKKKGMFQESKVSDYAFVLSLRIAHSNMLLRATSATSHRSDKMFVLKRFGARSSAPRSCPPDAACIESGRRGYAGLRAVSGVVISVQASFFDS